MPAGAALPPWLQVVLEGLLAAVVVALVAWLVARAAPRLGDWWQSDDVEDVRDFVPPSIDTADLLRHLRGLFRVRRRPALDAEVALGPDPADPVWRVRQLYRDVLRLGARLGRPRAPSETPREYQRALARVPPLADERDGLDLLTEIYVEARYAAAPPAPAAVTAAERALQQLNAEARAIGAGSTGSRAGPKRRRPPGRPQPSGDVRRVE